jgi:hypothetical protein
MAELTELCLGYLGQRDTNMISSICVASLKVVEANSVSIAKVAVAISFAKKNLFIC